MWQIWLNFFFCLQTQLKFFSGVRGGWGGVAFKKKVLLVCFGFVTVASAATIVFRRGSGGGGGEVFVLFVGFFFFFFSRFLTNFLLFCFGVVFALLVWHRYPMQASTVSLNQSEHSLWVLKFFNYINGLCSWPSHSADVAFNLRGWKLCVTNCAAVVKDRMNFRLMKYWEDCAWSLDDMSAMSRTVQTPVPYCKIQV